MTPTGSRPGALDGAWWPRSDDLTAELPALLDAVDKWLAERNPGHGEHISRVAVSLTIWSAVPKRVQVGGRRVRVAWFGSIDAHTISVSCPTDDHFELLVVPPNTEPESAAAAMVMAADPGNALRATDILGELSVAPARQPGGPHAWARTDPTPTAVWETEGGSIVAR